jgi:hypothetical protein
MVEHYLKKRPLRGIDAWVIDRYPDGELAVMLRAGNLSSVLFRIHPADARRFGEDLLEVSDSCYDLLDLKSVGGGRK